MFPELRLLFLLALLLLPSIHRGQTAVLRLANLADSLDLLPYVTEWADSSGKSPFDTACAKTFSPLSPAPIGTLPRWWLVQVQNVSGQPMPDVLLMAPRCSWVDFYEKSSNASDAPVGPRKGGMFTNYPNWPYPLSPVCFPLSFAPGERKALWLRVQHFEVEHPPSCVLLRSSMERQIYRDRLLGRMGGLFYNGIFWGILVFFTLLSTLQYVRLRERAMLFYALYSASLSLYYLRNLELGYDQRILFAWAMRHYIQWEILLQYAAYLAYMFFTRAFLDTAAQRPALDHWIRAGIWIYAVMLPLNLLVQAAFGEMAGLQLHIVTRALFVAMPVVFLLYLFRQQDTLGCYMSVGLLLLLLPLLVLAVEHLLGWTHRSYWGGAVRNTEGLWFYSPLTGILLEIVCFYWGLLHRNKLILNAKDAAEARLTAEIAARAALEKAHEEQLKKLTAALAGEQPTVPDDPLLAQLQAILAEHYADENFGTQELCKASGLSRSHLHRRLAALTGESASVFIRNYRLDQASLLLREGRLTVAEVAYRTGFGEPGYFSRMFAERFGVPPSGFREGKNADKTQKNAG